MRVVYYPCPTLPADVGVVVVRREEEVSIYVDSTGTVEAACEALTVAVQQHCDREWVHMGPHLTDSLRELRGSP